MNKIVTTIFGSRLYGTNTPTSDLDYKTIFLPEPKDIVLGHGKETVTTRRAKGEGEKNYAGEEEIECFSLKQYLKLLAEGQTVALDMLFTPSSFIVEAPNRDFWGHIQFNRDKLISKKSGAFVGYCRQQAKKYGIKGSRVAAVRLALEEFKFIEAQGGANDKIWNWSFEFECTLAGVEHIEFPEIEQTSGVFIKYLEVCGRKLQYTSHVKEGTKVLQKLFDEYGTRALQAEKNEGLDWKALSHAVRVGEEALELFCTGFITFPRPNASFLKGIKQGRYDYKEVAELIEQNFEDVEKAASLSSLPEDVDHKWIESFIEEVYSGIVVEHYHSLF